MTLKFVKPFFASFLDPHINTKPTLGSKFVDWNTIEESEINILLGAECAINKILQIAGEINNLSSSKPQLPPPPIVMEWGSPNYMKTNTCYSTQQTSHVIPMLAQCWSAVYEPYKNSYH